LFGILEKFHFESGCLNRFGARARAPARRRTPAHHVDPAVPRARAHAEAPENPAVRGRRHHHCGPKAHDARKWPRPVPRGLPILAGGQTAFHHWPPTRRTSPLPPRPCQCSCRSRSSGETASTRHRAYKTPPPFSSRAPEQYHSPLPPAISAAGELASPLAPVTNPQT
jgi:hypothetical protein